MYRFCIAQISDLLDEIEKFKDSIIIPEGGTNILGVKGCEEILNNTDNVKNYFYQV